MRKRIRQFFLWLLVFAGLSSCDKVTYYNFYIKNESSSEITVSGSDIIHGSPIEYTISPNDQIKIANWQQRGKHSTFFEPTAIFGNDLLITNEAEQALLKDYKLLTNWNPDLEDDRAVATHTYVLVITDADF